MFRFKFKSVQIRCQAGRESHKVDLLFLLRLKTVCAFFTAAEKKEADVV